MLFDVGLPVYVLGLGDEDLRVLYTVFK